MKMSNFEQLMQIRLANVAIGASAARGMGPKGTVETARTYLRKLQIQSLQIVTHSQFVEFLDKSTVDLQLYLPAGAQNWGAARKFMNLFLRDLLYNSYLCGKYKLNHLESWLEVPLDSLVAAGLHGENGSKDIKLKSWETIIRLTKSTSDTYQEFAETIAKRRGVARVHLDLIYWNKRS